MPINYVQVGGKDIADVVDRIEEAVEGVPNVTAAISCIIVATLAQNPEITPQRLQDVVKGVSEYLAASIFDESVMGSVN